MFLDRETPWLAKALVAAGLVYLVFPFDIIFDQIPFFGWLDDATIVTGLLWLAHRLVPLHVVDKLRKKYFGEYAGDTGK